MAGIYRQRHPELTVFYRVLFHYFDVIQAFGERINFHPHIHCLVTEGGTAPDGGRMRVISFIEEPKVIDRIIAHLELTFEAERPPPSQNVQQDLLMAAEERREYF